VTANELRVLIADDEPAALNGLARRLAEVGDARIVRRCRNGIEALEGIRDTAPDAAFLDVAMPGLSGVDVVRALAPSERPHIVFVTAYDEFAVQAFDLHAVDYLLKPFDRARLRETVGRLRERRERRQHHELGTQGDDGLDDLLRASPPPDRFVVKDGERIQVIPTHDIDWCEADDNYVWIHAGPRRHLVRMTMRRLEEQLPRATFARIHRSTIVNVERVRECAPLGGGEYRVTLVDGARLVLSRGYRAAVLNRLSGSQPP
jgi:two-component system LytT family response regulator